MARMDLETAIRLSAEVKGGGNITKVQREIQSLGANTKLTGREINTLRTTTLRLAQANNSTIAGIRSSIGAFRGLQEQAKIGSREFQRYGAEIQKLEGKLRGLDGTAKAAGDSLGKKLATGLAAAGIGRGLQQITMQAGRFDAEVRKAAAIEGGAGSFGVLQKEIEKVAAVAAGTPTEVAALATSLSRAGFSAQETTQALAGMVRGAEATSISFEEMGSIAADNLRAFGLQTTETGRVVDVLTQTANKSNQTVLDLGESMKYAAPIARSLGVPLEDLAAVMALLANNGIRGSDAGTALRTGLTRLQIAAGGADSEISDLTRGNVQLTKAMATLGSEILDTNGKLRPLDQVLNGLRNSLSGLSATDQAILAKALFGTEAGSKFQALLNSTEGQVKTMFAAVRNSGGVAEETQRKMQGFNYSIVVAGGNVEYLANQIGGMIGAAMKPLIDTFNMAISAAMKLPDPIRNIGAAAAAAGISTLGLVVAVNAVSGALALFGGASGIKAAITGLLSFQGVAALATKAAVALNLAVLGPWALVAAGLAAATAAAYKFNQPFKEFVDTIPQRFNAFWRSIGSDAEVASGRMRVAFDAAAKFIASGIRQMAADQRNLQAENRRTAELLVDSMRWAANSMGFNFSGVFDFIEGKWKGVVANIINFSSPLTTLLKGLGIDVGAAAMQAMTTDQQRLVAAGSETMHTSIGPNGEIIVYDTATGRPISNPSPFTPGTLPGAPSAPALPAPAGGGGGGAGTGGRAAAAEVKKGVKELLRLTDAEITAAVNTAIGEYGGLDPRGRTDVFANILARSRSPQYPSNLVDVVMQPGQYAPNFGRSRAQVTNPNLYGRARFEQVRGELMNPQMLAQSIQDVDSRLYFKGISEQRNMVRGVDFLRAPDQNFFHGPGRTDPGRNPQITSRLLSELGDTSAVTGYLDQQTQATEQFREQQQQIAGQIAEGNQALQERTREIDRQAELARAVSDIERRTLEYYFQQEDIQDRFDKLRDEALEQQKQALKFGVEFNLQDKLRLIGEQEKRELQLAEYNTAKELLDLRYAENDAIAERVRMMQDLTRQASEPTVFNVLEQQKAQLDEILQKYPAIGQAADAAATLATSGMAEMIAGTKSAKEVFADFLQGIASALIDTAKKMIAQYIAIGIARMFAGIGGSGFGGFAPGGVGGTSPALGFDPSGFAGGTGIPFFANGGIMSPSGPLPLKAYSRGGVASTPQVALFGEGSMNEAYVPLPDGRRIPVALQAPDGNRGDRMRELMGASPAGSNASPVLSMSFETTTLNGVEYVSRDQLESAMAETRKRAANDGAKRGMSMTLDRLQQSPATRSKVGIR